MNRVLLCLFLLLLFGLMQSQQRNILTTKATIEKLEENVLSVESYKPYPEYNNRAYWEGLPDYIRKKYIALGQELLDYDWPSLPATLILDFTRTGNRHRYEAIATEKREALFMLMLAELAEGKARFIDQIINGVWSVSEESTWVFSAHIGQGSVKTGLPDVNNPYVDLMAAEMATLVSLAYYFFGEQFDAISPQINQRIKHEVRKRVLMPAYEHDFWWMGFDTTGRRPNNWNPWICSNWMMANFIIEDDPRRRVKYTYKILEVLDNFLNPYPADGGCDEGPSYWNAAAGALFDNLVILNKATNDIFSYVYKNELIRNMGTYIKKVHIGNGYFVNFADASAKSKPGWEILFHYGLKIKDTGMMEFGSCRFEDENFLPGAWHIHRFLESFTLLKQVQNQVCAKPYPEFSWLPDVQVMTARDMQGRIEGFFIAAKGGHNAESHNHNDVGGYMVYDDAKPIFIDVGSGTYTKRTFSDERYSLWFNSSGYHNIPIINGFQQLPGRKYEASNVSAVNSGRRAAFSAEIQDAYSKEAGILKWKREIILDRSKKIRIKESYEFETDSNEIIIPLMTTLAPVQTNDKSFILHSTDTQYQIEFNETMDIQVEKLPLDLPEDEHLIKIWGEDIYRIKVASRKIGQKGSIMYTIKRI